MIPDDRANLRRDRRLRRLILQTLYRARVGPMKGLYGNRLLEMVEDAVTPGDHLHGDAIEFAGLMTYLVGQGYVKETDTRTRHSQAWAIGYLFFAILPQGERLVEEAIGPDPMIADDRIVHDAAGGH